MSHFAALSSPQDISSVFCSNSWKMYALMQVRERNNKSTFFAPVSSADLDGIYLQNPVLKLWTVIISVENRSNVDNL